MESKIAKELDAKQHLLDDLYKQERLRHEQELQELRSQLANQINRPNVAPVFLRPLTGGSRLGSLEDEPPIRFDEGTGMSLHDLPEVPSTAKPDMKDWEDKQAKSLLEMQTKMASEFDAMKARIIAEQVCF